MPMPPHRRDLIRVLGLGFGLAVTIGGVVGQGILRTPGLVAGSVPDPALILLLWTAGGVLAAITAVALVEVASAVPRAGGPYVFVGRAFGPFPGTVIGWTDLAVSVVASAYFAVVIAE
jgi:APA family basic amino acid/polyamine antiporter